MATRYLYAQSGSIIGSMNREDKRLYDQGGSVIASFDPPGKLRRASASRQSYMYRPGGSVYGYVSGVEKKYLYAPSGEIIGYFKPGFLECLPETWLDIPGCTADVESLVDRVGTRSRGR